MEHLKVEYQVDVLQDLRLLSDDQKAKIGLNKDAPEDSAVHVNIVCLEPKTTTIVDTVYVPYVLGTPRATIVETIKTAARAAISGFEDTKLAEKETLEGLSIKL
jgi:hypothetical protein